MSSSCALLGGFAIGGRVSLYDNIAPNAKCQPVLVLVLCLVNIAELQLLPDYCNTFSSIARSIAILLFLGIACSIETLFFVRIFAILNCNTYLVTDSHAIIHCCHDFLLGKLQNIFK